MSFRFVPSPPQIYKNMIGTSFLDLIAIRTSITLLRAITPLSILYTLSLPFLPSSLFTPTARLLSLYPICESAFYLLVYLPRKRHLQAAAQHPPPPPAHARRALFSKVVETINDYEGYLARWFLGADRNEVKVENIREFVRWSFFNESGCVSAGQPGKVTSTSTPRLESGGWDEEVEGEVCEYVRLMEEAMGRKFEEGRGSAECFRLTVDSVEMKHRPLIWYFILSAIDAVTFARLSLAGYTYRRRRPLTALLTSFPFRILETLSSRSASPSPTLAYWYRPHRNPAKQPILYIHGIGIGMHPYVPMLAALAAEAPDVGIIVLELDAISSRICAAMPTRVELTSAIYAILAHHNYIPHAATTTYGTSSTNSDGHGFVLAANSYGTVVTTHLLHTPHVARYVSTVVLIDPVTLLLHLPAVAYNFLRRKPRRANEHMLHYYASTDPGVAHTLCRRFFWAENVLWLEDLFTVPAAPPSSTRNSNSYNDSMTAGARQAVVYLGERDLIVDTWSVWQYLTNTDTTVGGDGDGDGGEVTVTDDEWVRRYPTGSSLKVIWCEGVDHAQVFDEERWYARIVQDLVAASGRSRG
ncbi:hypothetical protein Dda_7549 [Drechslerella dactyloides]|uniref:Alpha/beta-hydrolase n=1 Tax=Drechslerella dactyloides TaxID=74499 RepID=A0AAD6IU81_DREDA|nr:hypothetical protein Dda_7549 [Drechslerella dactyloides]